MVNGEMLILSSKPERMRTLKPAQIDGAYVFVIAKQRKGFDTFEFPRREKLVTVKFG